MGRILHPSEFSWFARFCSWTDHRNTNHSRHISDRWLSWRGLWGHSGLVSIFLLTTGCKFTSHYLSIYLPMIRVPWTLVSSIFMCVCHFCQSLASSCSFFVRKQACSCSARKYLYTFSSSYYISVQLGSHRVREDLYYCQSSTSKKWLENYSDHWRNESNVSRIWFTSWDAWMMTNLSYYRSTLSEDPTKIRTWPVLYSM